MSYKQPQSVIDHYDPYRSKGLNTKIHNVQNTTFELDEKYQVMDAIGQGAYGIVVAVRDRETDEFFAIKKISRAFDHKIIIKRTLRELRILRLLKHENFMNNRMLLLPKSREDFNEIYIVSELMETDLASIIKSPQPIIEEHIQIFLYQIIRGLKYLHTAGILHRDLKPRNLQINSNCDQKICDFGLSRVVLPETMEKGDKQTNYVTTRWYRAPEVLLGYDCYGPGSDMWSVGCILAELMTRKPFFNGKSTKDQQKVIVNMIGSPTPDDLSEIRNKSKIEFLSRFAGSTAQDLNALLPKAHPLAVDLLKKMLVFDPRKRITNEQALAHPYLSELHDPNDEPEAERLKIHHFDFEPHSFTTEQYKDMVYEELVMYNFPELNDKFFANAEEGKSNVNHIIENDNKEQVCSEDSKDNESIDWS